MDKQGNEKIIVLISVIVNVVQALMSVIGPILSKETPTVVQIIISSCIFLAVLGVIFYYYHSWVRVRNSISSTAIIAKSKKYIKYLYKLAKTNEKTLEKHAAVNELKAIEKLNKRVVKMVGGKKVKCKKDKLQALRDELNTRIQNYQSKKYQGIENAKDIIKISDKIDSKKSYEITQLIIETIEDLNRILLQIDQHKLRINFGKYIAKYTKDEKLQVKAYVEYIGWTNILIGKIKKGFEAIMTGISLIEQKISDGKTIPNGMSVDEYCDWLFHKARAYRHLGTTYYTYTSKQINPSEYLQKALEIVDNPVFKEYYETKDLCKYQRLRIGIENNILLARYYKLSECMKSSNLSQNKCTYQGLYEEVKKLIPDIDKLKKVDKHRVIKLLVLENQIIKSNKCYQGSELGNLKENLRVIKNVLDENINFDDAMEVFIQQKIQFLYDQVLEMINA